MCTHVRPCVCVWSGVRWQGVRWKINSLQVVHFICYFCLLFFRGVKPCSMKDLVKGLVNTRASLPGAFSITNTCIYSFTACAVLYLVFKYIIYAGAEMEFESRISSFAMSHLHKIVSKTECNKRALELPMLLSPNANNRVQTNSGISVEQ